VLIFKIIYNWASKRTKVTIQKDENAENFDDGHGYFVSSIPVGATG